MLLKKQISINQQQIMEINSWETLIEKVNQKNNHMNNTFSKLLIKIKKTINEGATTLSEQFANCKLIYEQLLVECDITDLFVDIQHVTNNTSVIITMFGVGKWIKLHSGNSSRLFFFDEEKTIISDKSIADFINKIISIRPEYKYFGKEPVIYYKFKTLPDNDIVEYLAKFDITATTFDEPTDKIDYGSFGQTVLLDQSILLTLCSNLSFGLSNSLYLTSVSCDRETMIKNKEAIDFYLMDKKIIVNKYVYDQTVEKIHFMAGENETKRFKDLVNKMTVVPDADNKRFYHFKNIERNCISVAEREHAIIVTNNVKMCNKINTYYQEMPYKLFSGVQLSEKKYM